MNFYYGESSVPTEKSENFFSYNSVSQDLCFFSLPKFLFSFESGFKFQVCSKVTSFDLKEWEEIWNSDEYLFKKTIGDLILEKIRISEWENEKKEKIIQHSWIEKKLESGEVTYSRFNVPAGELILENGNYCNFAFPERSLETTSTVIVLRFPCLPWGNQMVTNQNKIWENSCVLESPRLTENFRHSESRYGRYLEFSNETALPVCASKVNLLFIAEDGKTSDSDFDFPLVLPKGSFILKINSGILGMPLDEKLSLSIGKKGLWQYSGVSIPEVSFSFKQNSEFFSFSRLGDSCALQSNFYKTRESFCGNPGISNRLWKESLVKAEIPSCKATDLELLEFFPGDDLEQFAFLEWKLNGKESCDASNLEIIYQGETFSWSAIKETWEPNQIKVLSAFSFEGWGFFSKTRGLSRGRIDFGLPTLEIIERDTNLTRKFFETQGTIPLYKRINAASLSISPDPDFGWAPVPEVTPGMDIIRTRSLIEAPTLSELFVESGFDGIKTSPEDRFMEIYSDPSSEGLISFSVSKKGKEQRFLAYKLKNEEHSVFSSRAKNCLPDGYTILPDGVLTAEDLDFRIGASFTWSYKHRFWGDFGRRSLHPERLPFVFSAHLPNVSLFESLCRTHAFASPGFKSSKQNRIKSFVSSSSDFSEYQSVEPLRNEINRIGNGLEWISFTGTQIPNFGIAREGELIFSEWNLGSRKEIKVHRKGDLEITAFSRHPRDSQNEWIRFCNRSGRSLSLENHFIQDETSQDRIVPYQTRFPSISPKFRQTNSFILNSLSLNANQCALLVDPDGKDWRLPLDFYRSDLLLTITSTSTLGNGLSIGESFAFLDQSTNKPKVVASLGQIAGTSFFRIEESIGQVIRAKEGTTGDEASDYFLESEERYP